MSLRTCYAMSGTDLAYAATGLRAPYAVCGTDLGHAAIGLRPCYAMASTDTLLSAYAMPGTERAYGPTRRWYEGARS
eukprot:3581658-Rhodomonas_salina.2